MSGIGLQFVVTILIAHRPFGLDQQLPLRVRAAAKDDVSKTAQQIIGGKIVG